MSRQIIFFFFILFSICRAEAQISEGGLPPSFNYEMSFRSGITTTEIPLLFNVEDLLLVDEWQVAHGSPLAVATAIPVTLNTTNSGKWFSLPGGETIWQLRLRAKDAIALMLYYKAFEIPEGGKLFLYNADKTHILGAYTHRTNPRGGRFATEFVAGDELVLEYVAAPSGESPRIEIEEIGYGYNHLHIVMGNDLRSSNPCEVNINCSEGAAWQREKAGICHTVQKINGKSYICSGSLVNNTAQDFKPYVLMAYHCMEAVLSADTVAISTPEEMQQWMFYFNYERQGCANDLSTRKKTMTGCTLVASSPLDGGSDGLLVLLDQEVPEDYNVYYNGWDRRNNPPKSGVSIHHPAGDYKKISTYTSAARTGTWYDVDSKVGKRNAHWNVIFAATENGHGVTEGGSSGAPLFNENQLIVGTLSGGTSSCRSPLGDNLFGKLAYHWNKVGEADTARMDIWLDPKKTGVETLSGLARTPMKAAPRNLQISKQNKDITLTWQAPASTEKPTHYTIYRTNQLIGTSSKTTYTDSNLSALGEVIYSVTAEYADKNESSPLRGSINIAEYKTPTDLVLVEDNSKVSLSWKAPVYTQAISWATSQPVLLLGINGPIYFGHLWEPEDLKNMANNTITGVELYAANKADYELQLIQGNKRYTQPIATPRASKVINAELTTPFVIDASKELWVILYTKSTDPEIGTMALDAGPATVGKGNLISEDGKEWFVLFDGKAEETEEDYNNNFYLAAIVSSEKGTVTRLSPASSAGKEYKKKFPARLSKLPYQDPSFRSLSTRPTQLQYPAAFPEITGYNIYRNGRLITSAPINRLQYTDRTSEGAYSYGVSTVYADGEESEQVVSSQISVSNIAIKENEVSLYPTVFKEQVRIANAHLVNRLEIYAISGQLVLQIDQPEEVIPTNAFSTGVYIFRLYTSDGIKTIQTIKK